MAQSRFKMLRRVTPYFLRRLSKLSSNGATPPRCSTANQLRFKRKSVWCLRWLRELKMQPPARLCPSRYDTARANLPFRPVGGPPPSLEYCHYYETHTCLHSRACPGLRRDSVGATKSLRMAAGQ